MLEAFSMNTPYQCRRMLIVAAHPDDEVLGAGGFAARCKLQGGSVYVQLLTAGRLARPDGDDSIPGPCKEANDVIGVDELVVGRFRDLMLDKVPTVDLVRAIERYANTVNPDIVLTHQPGDIGQDHQAVHRAAMIAFRPTGIVGSVSRLLMFEIPSATGVGRSHAAPFVPNVFIDIGMTLERKEEALRHYDMEMRAYPQPRSYENVRNLAYLRGASVGCAAAEAYALAWERW